MKIDKEFFEEILSKAKARWAKMDKQQRVYFVVTVCMTVVILWAFITAGIITTNFNRNSIRSGEDRQELQVSSMGNFRGNR